MKAVGRGDFWIILANAETIAATADDAWGNPGRNSFQHSICRLPTSRDLKWLRCSKKPSLHCNPLGKPLDFYAV